MTRDIVISRSARNEEVIMTCDIVIIRTQGIVYIESLPSVVVVIIIEFILHFKTFNSADRKKLRGEFCEEVGVKVRALKMSRISEAS